MILRVYLRRSKGDEEQTHSLDVQRNGAQDYVAKVLVPQLILPAGAWAERVEYVDDGRSRTDFVGREALTRLLDEARPRDVIIARDQSRVGGDALDTTVVLRELVMRRKCRLFYYSKREEFLYATVMDALVPFVEGIGNQREVEEIRGRTREALRERVKTGRLAGGRCFGYRNVQHPSSDGRKKNTTAVIDDAEAEVVRRVFIEARAGRGFKCIARDLNADGHRNRSGAPWSDAAVRVLLTNDRYRGIYIHGRVKHTRVGRRRIAEAADPSQVMVIEMPEWRIVDDLTFAAVKATFKARESGPRAVGPATKYALTGIARCAHCGGAVGVDGRTIVSRDGQRVRVPAYTCLRRRKKGPCPVTIMQEAAEVEGALADFVQANVLSPEVVEMLVAGIREEVQRQASQPAADLGALEKNIERLDREQRSLANAIAAGGDLSVLLDGLRARQKESTELKIRLEAARRAPSQTDDLVAKVELAVRQKLGDLRASLAKDSAGARDAYSALFPNGLNFKPMVVDPHPGQPRTRRVWAITGMAHLGVCDLIVTPPGLEPGHPT